MKMNVDKVLSVVKQIKLETALDKQCNIDGLYYKDTERLELVKEVEKKLEVESSDLIFDTINNKELKVAAEMFIYLNTCPADLTTTSPLGGFKDFELWFKPWYIFYKDLFNNKPADKILLTLNRMMKIKSQKDIKGKLRAENLLKRATDLLGLKYKRIQSMLPTGTSDLATNNETTIIELSKDGE